MKTILVTGGTGLIGKESIPFLLENDFNIYILTTNLSNLEKSSKFVKYIYCNIFDFNQVEKIFDAVKPEYLLHFAWLSTGLFDNNINYKYLIASLHLLECFYQNDGKRFVGAGTYAEYGSSNEILTELHPTNPYNSYSFCKDSFNKIASVFCKKNGISYAWARVFSAFGLEQDSRRLTGDIIKHFLNNELLTIRNSSLIRDYIYSKDAANAFVSLLSSTVEGNVNICSGTGVSIRDFTSTFGSVFKKSNLIRYEDNTTNQPNRVIGDPCRLINEVGFKPKYSLYDSIMDIYNTLVNRSLI